MTVKTLIQEAMNKNALGFEAALKEELRARMALALEAKMNGDDDEDEQDDENDVDDRVEINPEDGEDDDDEEKEVENAKMRNESRQLDEISSKLAAKYSVKASDSSKHRSMSTKKVDNRYAGVKMADEKIRKMDGKNSSAKVATSKE